MQVVNLIMHCAENLKNDQKSRKFYRFNESVNIDYLLF